MKKKQFNTYVLVMFVFIGIWILILNSKRQTEEIKTYIDLKMAERNHLDTLYWRHLEQCSFTQKKGLEPDKNN